MSFFDTYKIKYAEDAVKLIDSTVSRITEDCADVLTFTPNQPADDLLLFTQGEDGHPKDAGFVFNEHSDAIKIITPCKGDPGFPSRQIPDEAFLLVLIEDPALEEYLDALSSAGIKVDKLKDVIKEYYLETLSYVPDREISKERVFGNGLTSTLKWTLDYCDDPSGYDPIWTFYGLLSDQVLPTNPHYSYENAGLNRDTLQRAMQSWSTTQPPNPEP